MNEDLQLRIQASLDAAEASNSAKDLKKSMRELNALAEEVGIENQAAYFKIKEAAGAAALKVREMNQSTKALAATPLGATTKSFGLIKESLMTMNFEQLSKSVTLFAGSMSKLNPAGLTKGFGELGQSLMTLGKALLTNPIFLIAAAVVLIITQFEKLKEMGGLVGKIFMAIGDAIKFVLHLITAFTDAIGLTNIAGKKKTEKMLENIDEENKALEKRYALETDLAKITGRNVSMVEYDKLAEKLKNNQKAVQLLKDLEKANGELSDEEKKELKKRQEAVKESLDEIKAYYAKNQLEIIEGQKEFYKKSTEYAVATIKDPVKKATAEANKAVSEQLEEEEKQYKALTDKIRTQLQMLTDFAKSTGMAFSPQVTATFADLNHRLEDLNKQHQLNTKQIELKGQQDIDEAKKTAAEKAASEAKAAAEKRFAALKKADEELLKYNQELQQIITEDVTINEDNRLKRQVENIEARKKLLKKELADKIITQQEYDNQITKLGNDQLKLAKANEDAKRKLADETIKRQLDNNLREAQEKKKAAVTFKEQEEADIEIARAANAKRVNDAKLTGVKLLEALILELKEEEKIKQQYAVKARQKELNDLIQDEQLELNAVKKKGFIRAGEESRIIKSIGSLKNKLLMDQMNQELKLVEKGSKDEQRIRKRYADQMAQNDADAAKQSTQAYIQSAQQKLAIAQQATGVLTSLNDLITQNEEQGLKKGEKVSIEVQKRQFNRHKALGIVSAIINTAQGITAALGQEPPLSFVMAALTGVMGAVQIATIASKQFNPESGGGDSGGSAPSITAPSLATPATLSSNFSSGHFFAAGTARAQKGNAMNTNNRVYVVESDITKTQNRVAVTQGQSTLSGRH